LGRVDPGAAVLTLATNKLINQGKLYWYIGSMAARSLMQKKRMEV
jgi:hypothetical protein